MPEGDTIHYAANKIRPVLEGQVPDEIATPHPRFGRDRWPQRLQGQAVKSVDAHGKHLFLRFENGLVIHSHLRMTGKWRVRDRATFAPPRNTWLLIRRGEMLVAQINGPVLELMTELPHAAGPADRRPRPRHPRPRARRARSSCGGCARTTRRARSATP